MSKIDLIPFPKIACQLDLDAIANAILNYRDGETSMTDEDFSDCKRMVWETGENWLPRDLYDLQITGVESEHRLPLTNFEKPIKMFIDLEGESRGLVPTFKDFAGKRVCIDWKTRDGALDTSWKDRQVGSWQWRIYARAREAGLFIYRGISRQINIPRWEKFREVIIVPPQNLQEQVDEYLTGTLEQRQVLVNIGLDVWPRSMPSACNAYGRECPFLRDCEQYTMPRFVPEDREMSYTQITRFALCPEKHRRLINEPGEEDNESTNFGTQFHRGAAEMWRQGMELQKGRSE